MHQLISLIGMPGGGKSTIGRQLARRLNVRFVDSDTVIEQRLGRTIRDYFEQQGEAAFRELEAATLAGLIEETPSGVIATGGGIVLRPGNRQALQRSTVCVYLRSAPEELFRRLRRDVKRPLLQVADPLARLRELHATRDPLYRETAQFIVETGRPSVPTLVNMMLMQLELAGVIDASAAPSMIDAAPT